MTLTVYCILVTYIGYCTVSLLLIWIAYWIVYCMFIDCIIEVANRMKENRTIVCSIYDTADHKGT